MSMEEEGEILLYAHGCRFTTPNSRVYSCGDLYRVNFKTGQAKRYGGDELYGSNTYTSMAALGDEIYMVGGGTHTENIETIRKKCGKKDIHIHNEVSRINVFDFDGGWKNVTPFNDSTEYKDRKLPFVTLNNKLYLFGGGHCHDHTFAEVYDPTSPEQWAFLPSVPVPQQNTVGVSNNNNCSRVSFPVLADSENDRIILHLPCLDSIYAYYPSERVWRCLVNSFNSWSELTVFSHGMLLFYTGLDGSKPILTAFDLVTHEWLNPEFDPDFGTYNLPDDWTSFDALLPMEHPRGTFCFASAYSQFDGTYYNEHCNRTYLVFLKFSVERPNCSGDPYFKFIDFREFSIDWRCTVWDYLPILGKMSKRNDTSEEVIPSRISKDEPYIWRLLKDMELGDEVARAYRFLAMDPNSLSTLRACPIQKRKKVLEILMETC